MPYYWTRIKTSPPLQRREEVRAIVKRYEGTLVADELFFELGKGYARILVHSDDEAKLKAMLEELEADPPLPLIPTDQAEEAYQLRQRASEQQS